MNNKNFYEFHKKIVQETIDFIRDNPEIQKLIESKKKEISEDYIPDLRVYFMINGLEESVQSGEWVPSTDSSLGIYLGNVDVIFSA